MHGPLPAAPDGLRLLTVIEASQCLSIAPATLRRLLRVGQIPSVTINGLRRVRSTDLETILRHGLGGPREPRGVTRSGSAPGRARNRGRQRSRR